jgi:hypothetical protein
MGLKRDHGEVLDAISHGPALVLASTHDLSIALAAEAPALSTDLPLGVAKCSVVGTGLVEITLRAGNVRGFGARDWPLLVGGQGVGDEPDIAAAIGTSPLSPVAVRFGTLIPLDTVDDCGFVDGTFWEGMDDRPTLRSIALRAVEWLEHPPADKSRLERWSESARLAFAKAETVSAYRKCALCPNLVSDMPSLLPEWLAPELASVLCGGTPAPSKEALLAAIRLEHFGDSIYAFDLFSPSFCATLSAEIDVFEATPLPRRRPNTMNNFGLVINDIGMEPLMTVLLRRLIAPLASLLYTDEPFAASLDHHHRSGSGPSVRWCALHVCLSCIVYAAWPRLPPKLRFRPRPLGRGMGRPRPATRMSHAWLQFRGGVQAGRRRPRTGHGKAEPSNPNRLQPKQEGANPSDCQL